MPKNIVICCDGTDNKLTIDKNTNIIHLYSCLRNNDNQIAYYNPGVGTIAPDNYRNKIKRILYKINDLVTASSLEQNVADAYIYLMNQYEDEDQIYLFGFSRGAYTVRMLSGLIQMFGLLHKGNESHLRHVLTVYSQADERFNTAPKFKKRFSRKIDIRFMGIWDTVVSVGGPIKYYIPFPYTDKLEIVKSVRHAVAIDERRKHYRFSEINKTLPDRKEVFFAGVHSDIGGSYAEEESGLSKITLEWMLGEASNCGLNLDYTKVKRYIYGEGQRSKYQKPDFTHKIHNSLTLLFIISDFIPRLRFKKNGWFFEMTIDFKLWPKRKIPCDAMIHSSVFDKISAKNIFPLYKPTNIRANCNYLKIHNLDLIYHEDNRLQ